MISFTVNGRPASVDVEPETPLLWVLREKLNLTGTKFGCGAGLCGACTAHVAGEAVRTCQTPVESVAGKVVTTIEGATPGSRIEQLQRAWIAEQVPQCGYCQPGMIMAAAAMPPPPPTTAAATTTAAAAATLDAQIDATMTNLCRCGSYDRVRKAIHRAARSEQAPAPGDRP